MDQPRAAEPTLHHRACNLCEAMCGVTVTVADNRAIRVVGDREDPLSRGHICAKAVGLIDLAEDPDRLRHPERRIEGGWQRVGWDEALDEAAGRIHAIQERYGRDAVAFYAGNPTVHNTGASLYAPMFSRALGTRSRFSATSVDQLPAMLAAYWMFGHQLLLPVPDLDRADLMLILGGNPVASNGSLMGAPGFRARVEALKARGGQLIVVDPRRTETAEIATRFHFIKPGADAWLLLALTHEVCRAGPRLGHLEGLAEGLDRLVEAVAPFTPERASGPTGLSPEEITALARALLDAPTAVVYGRVGTSTQEFGALCCVLIYALNALTGNLDRAGGVMFPLPALDPLTLPRGVGPGPGSFGRFFSRVRGLPEFGGELPVAALAEEIDTPGEGQIKALITLAGNPVLSTPNGRRLERALAGLEYMVSIDLYRNETTAHAHLILPPPSPLERAHYDTAFHLFGVRVTSRFAAAALDPGPDARHDGEIMLGLARRLLALRGGSVRERAMLAGAEALGLERALDLALRAGPYGSGVAPWANGLNLNDLKKHPHGLDLGPLQPCLPQRLIGRRGRIDLAPAPALADLARLVAPREAPEEGALLMIGRRDVRDNNSWLHNSPRLMKGRTRCTLMIHPQDAAARGLVQGGLARVRSRVGQVVAPVQITDQVMPGVVSLPHGYGHDRPGTLARVARAQPGVSANDLNDELRLDALSGNAAFSGLPVMVSPAP